MITYKYTITLKSGVSHTFYSQQHQPLPLLLSQVKENKGIAAIQCIDNDSYYFVFFVVTDIVFMQVMEHRDG